MKRLISEFRIILLGFVVSTAFVVLIPARTGKDEVLDRLADHWGSGVAVFALAVSMHVSRRAGLDLLEQERKRQRFERKLRRRRRKFDSKMEKLRKEFDADMAQQRQQFQLGLTRTEALEETKRTIIGNQTALQKFRALMDPSRPQRIPMELGDIPSLVSLCRRSSDAYRAVRRHFPEEVQVELDFRIEDMEKGIDEIGKDQTLKDLATALSGFLDGIGTQIETQLGENIR